MKHEFAEPLRQLERVFVRVGGTKLLYFGGCDYFRFSSRPEIHAALHRGLDEFGLNTSASRRTTGNHTIYEKLETRAAAHFGAPRATYLSSGYLANIALAEALRGEVDLVLADERSHGSLQQAAAFLGVPTLPFKHGDAEDLRRKAASCRNRSRLVVLTDGIFACDGSLAPLAVYRKLLGPAAWLWVDDAHAAGVIGKNGAGSIAHAGISRRNVIQTITFSKAFGVYGGMVLSDAKIRRLLVSKSAAVCGNTPLPLPLASASLLAMELLTDTCRTKLQYLIELFWKVYADMPPPSPSPIVAVAPGTPAAVKKRLLNASIYPSFIHYPGGPAEKYFRFALSSEHTPEQVAHLARTLRPAARADRARCYC